VIWKTVPGRLAVIFCLGVCLFLSAGVAAQSPLVPPAGAEEAASAATGPLQQVLQSVHDIQRDLHRRLAAAVRALKDEGAGAVIFLIGISLLYGVFHAVGPGHGKAVISAYLLANESAVRRGVLLAFLASFVQGLSAVLLVAVLALFLGMAGLAVTQSVDYLESASYALVALIGAWMLLSLLSPDRVASRGHASDKHDHDACGHSHAPDPALVSGLSDRSGPVSKALGLVLAVGVRPCSGAVLVLLFAMAHGVFLAGVAATFAMAFGTAVTVSALAVLTLFSKRVALAAVGAESRWIEVAYRGLGLLGAGLLFLLGISLFWGSLGPAPPF